ncbi:MAG: DUF6152 family protein [Hylemonella sp.]|uniref:DUF6152 family protein n=1 Tax=Hylemonella sp. TaxID=2066020 RepID=UPI0022C9F988|nr:DUF6152 family protein [Hylemonella sp.]MCZ8251843.1 DUF6152 family protein [Hylemonella sp.]
MQRRTAMGLVLLPGLLPLARAHHGWSSFDQDRPIYLQGRVQSVRWQNPHAELVLEVAAGLSLPADLAQRPLPAQSAPVDGKALLAKAQLPRRQDRRWEIELAPLSRMQAWKVTPLKVGDEIAVLGFTFQDEKGEAILRVEYLFVGSQVYGLRSSPA